MRLIIIINNGWVMLSALVIVFREILEMSLVISVLLAATKGVPKRGQWIMLGMLVGALCAIALASATGVLTFYLSDEAMRIFKITILLIAALLIAYTVIWMQTQGKKIGAELKQLGNDIKQGNKSMFALMIIVAIVVMREGSEIALFLYSIVASEGTSLFSVAIGSLFGALIGISVGLLMYFGLLRIPVKSMFNYSSILLALIAAGMVAKAISKLIAMDIFNGIIPHLWNTSWLISDKSVFGKLLSVLVGYQSEPSLLALLAYICTLVLIYIGYKVVKTNMNALRSVTV